MSTENKDKINKLFDATISTLTRPDKQDWMQCANDYVVDTFGSPNLMHFKSSATDEQKGVFSKAVIEAMKHGNKELLVPNFASGHVKEESPEPKKKKAKKEQVKESLPDKPDGTPELPEKKGCGSNIPKPTAGSIEEMLVQSVLSKIGEVYVPTEVIEATVKHEVEKLKETFSKQLEEVITELKSQVTEFTKSTPPRDVFNVQLTVNSQAAMDASARVTQEDILNAIPAITEDHETK